MGQLIYKNDKPKLPFVSGYVLQNYSTAEKGILDAFQNGYEHWYVDCSLMTDSHNKWNASRINQLQHLIQELQVFPIIHGNYKVPLSSEIEEIRHVAIEYTKKEMDLAASVSAPLIIHGGAIVEPRLVKKVKKLALEKFLSSISLLSEYAARKNVRLYLENLSNYKNFSPFHYIFTHDEEFDFIFSSVDLPFFLDLGHANIGNYCPKTIFEKYNKRIVGMSFSNNNSEYDQHLSLSKGTIDYLQIIKSIESVGWKGLIAFETRDKSPDESIEELRHLFQYVKMMGDANELMSNAYDAR